MLHVVFLQLFEQYEKGKAYSLERTLANGLVKRNICVPFTVHQEMVKEAEEKRVEAQKLAEKSAMQKAEEEAALAKKVELENAVVDQLLAGKDEIGKETAVSAKAKVKKTK